MTIALTSLYNPYLFWDTSPMLMARVIPCLLLQGTGLVKTVRFKQPHYVGDPINIIRIFNEKEVDELILLDIQATPKQRKPAFAIVEQVVSECFMPLTYGGGIRSLEDAKQLFALGVEKIAINAYALENPCFIAELAHCFGSQSIIVSIDVQKNIFNKKVVRSHSGQKSWKTDPVQHALNMQNKGAGEILLTAIHQDGTFAGYDLPLLEQITNALTIPVIACGGAGCVEDIAQAVQNGASAAALGSLVVYQGKNKAVLTNFPDRQQLENLLTS